MKHLIATRNPGKFAEIYTMLSSLEAQGFSFVSLEDLGIIEECAETGSTYEENALLKAQFYARLSGLPTISDDSGIHVDALADELGVQTRRWGAGPTASDEEWLNYFMKRMEQETLRTARFVCAAAIVNGDASHVFTAETLGVITSSIEVPVKIGIPLSSVFKPEGSGKVYSALSAEEKNRFSHRGKAFTQLLDFLRTQA